MILFAHLPNFSEYCVPAGMTPFSPTSFFAISPMVFSFAALRLVGRIRASGVKYRWHRPHGNLRARQGEDGRAPDLDQHGSSGPGSVDHHDDRVLAKEGIAGRLRGVGAGKGKLGDIPVLRRTSGERVAVELHDVLEGKTGLDADLDDAYQVVTASRLAGRDGTGHDWDVAGKADGKGGPEVELTEHDRRDQGEHNHPTHDDQQPAPCHHRLTSPEGSH